MKIDLFTFISQVINFTILAVLLYYFLFKKIIPAIDEREETIRNEFKEAEKKKEEAQQSIEEHEKQLSTLNAQKDQLMKEARTQANEEKEKLLEEARRSIFEKKEDWEKQLEREKADFLSSLQEKIGETVYSISESIVNEIANVDLQTMIYKRFIEIMETLSESQIQTLRTIYSEEKEKTIALLSSFELSEEEKNNLEQILSRFLETKPTIAYQIDSTRFLGINLRVKGFELNWTAQNYFEKLEEKFKKVLAETNA